MGEHRVLIRHFLIRHFFFILQVSHTLFSDLCNELHTDHSLHKPIVLSLGCWVTIRLDIYTMHSLYTCTAYTLRKVIRDSPYYWTEAFSIRSGSMVVRVIVSRSSWCGFHLCTCIVSHLCQSGVVLKYSKYWSH